MAGKFYIIALHSNGRIQPETYELLSFAREMGKEAEIIILGSEPGAARMAEELAGWTGTGVICLTSRYLEVYRAQAYRDALKEFLSGQDRFLICIPHTAMGYDFAPVLAAALDIECITAIEDIRKGSFIRSMFSGRVRARTIPSGRSAVLTVQPGAWQAAEHAGAATGSSRSVPVDIPPGTTITQGLKKTLFEDIGFSHADVIVSAGRGIGSEQNLDLIKKLAGLFPRSAIGATRAVCDLGWLGYRHQIGVTGNTVSPKLYIACGISGAVQHISGMKNSRIIVAINTDPHAAIFRAATYCIVEDVTTFIPLVLEEYSRRSDTTLDKTS